MSTGRSVHTIYEHCEKSRADFTLCNNQGPSHDVKFFQVESKFTESNLDEICMLCSVLLTNDKILELQQPATLSSKASYQDLCVIATLAAILVSVVLRSPCQ